MSLTKFEGQIKGLYVPKLCGQACETNDKERYKVQQTVKWQEG